MAHEVRIQRAEPRPLAVVHRLASAAELGKVVPDACGLVWNVLRAQNVTGAGRHIAIYFDDRINLDVGVELESSFAGHGEVVGSSTPAGTVATTTHLGPYHQLHLAHDAILRWCEGQGYPIAGPRWEVYGHWEDAWNADPAKIRTDVFYLLTGT
ncbi:MAG: GyrI-like domain-containing protein [Isosphaeraceae bacterium]